MAQNIILKRSSVSGKVPTTSSLSVGEIAINTFDGRVFLHVSSSATSSIQHILTTNSITTGSITLTQTGSFAELVITQDGNFNRDIYVTRDIVGNGDLDIAGTLTASLQQGYVWVGGVGNITKLVATSSLGGTSSEGAAYTHIQSIASSTWTVNHNLNNAYPAITIYDNSGYVVIPQNIQSTSVNQSVITFSYSTTGYATAVSSGGTIVSTATSASYADYAVTASYALNAGAGGLETKAGSVTNTSFSGNPRKATVTFTTAFSNTNYAISITGEDARSWIIESKVAGSFVINSNSNTALAGNTYWIATAYGET